MNKGHVCKPHVCLCTAYLYPCLLYSIYCVVSESMGAGSPAVKSEELAAHLT